MTRATLLIALLALPAAVAAEPEAVTIPVPVTCGKGDIALRGAANLGQRQLLHGELAGGGQMVFVTNPDSDSWTVLIRLPDAEGTMCVLATGSGMTPGAIEPLGEPS